MKYRFFQEKKPFEYGKREKMNFSDERTQKWGAVFKLEKRDLIIQQTPCGKRKTHKIQLICVLYNVFGLLFSFLNECRGERDETDGS